ncbi:MAG TPA: FAD-dependent oxidoreductase, partial [Gemmatimonadales bacterium]|nr:FAD-dependent oxidoreductase [Gemmatimonadales bacterium]
SVQVLDPDLDRGQAWRAAAGMLAAQIEAQEGDALLELALAGREFYTSLAPALLETTGIDIGLWRDGIANVALDDADVIELRAKVASQRQQGQLVDWLEPSEVKTRWPWMGRTCGALWAPQEGALDPIRLVQALRADAALAGATLVADDVVGIDVRGDRIVGVVGRKGRYGADHVVLAAGAWTGSLAGLPRPVSVVPVRGQMAAQPWPRGVEPAIVYAKNSYVLARGAEALCGSTMECAGFDPTVTSDGLARIRAAATAICPPLAATPPARTWAGLRPMTPDGLPILGAEPRLRGLWYATGHGRHGILLAGITGLMLRLLVNGQTPTEDLSPFRPERFWNW